LLIAISVVLVTAYVVPAVIVWASAGLVLNVLPLRTVALIVAVALGAAHAAGRACALLRDAHGIDVADYLESVRKRMYWRRFDGYALLTIGGAAMLACLRALAG